MTGITRTSADLDERRRRVLYRSWRRGTREMDLIVGRYAEAVLGRVSDADLDVFEHLIEAPDRDLYAWITGALDVPGNYDTPVFRSLQAFHAEGAGVNGLGL